MLKTISKWKNEKNNENCACPISQSHWSHRFNCNESCQSRAMPTHTC